MAKINLGRTLRKIKDDAVPDKPLSVVDTIDKALLDGVTSVGSFSLLGIKRTAKVLHKSLEDTDSFDRDQFFVDMMKLYNMAMAPDMRAKNVFHPSGLMDDCPRKLTYDLLKTPPTDAVHRGVSATLQRIFDVGTWYHLYFQNILFQAGVLDKAEVPVVNKEKYINGKADGLFKVEVFGELVVLEIKSMNSWVFSKAIFKPFKKHEFQASIYARELGATKVLYLYVNKDTSETREFLMPLNEEMLAQADKKINLVIGSVKDGTLPNRMCADRMVERSLSCPFRSLCFK